MFFKIGVLKKFTHFTGKQLCWSLFFNKVAGPRSATLLKNRHQHRCFPVKFVKFLRTLFSTDGSFSTVAASGITCIDKNELKLFSLGIVFKLFHYL